METIRCDLCGADDSTVLIRGEDWEGAGPGEFALVRCNRCGLMYLNPRPTLEEIGAYYPKDYAPYRPAIEDERWGLMRWMRRRKMTARRRLIEQYSGCRNGKILDVGCSTGLFLHEMDLHGWQARGVELSPDAAGYARSRFGLEVFEGTLTDAHFEPGSFDAVTFWDVLEHTFSPAAELEKTAKLLRPGGLVAINIPNWDSADRKWFGPHWIGLDPPRHLYFFTRDTMEQLLRKTGFEPVRWQCFMPSYFSFAISVERWLRAKAPRMAGPASRLLNLPGMRLLFEPYFSVANRFKRGGVIAVFARKREPEG